MNHIITEPGICAYCGKYENCECKHPTDYKIFLKSLPFMISVSTLITCYVVYKTLKILLVR